MARSFIDPSLVAMAVEPAAPPWNWNPGQTFVQAFNDAQENQRAQEKMAMERELNAILFPAKKAQAEFTMKQLAYESERMENAYKLLNEQTDERRRLLREGRSGGSGSGGGTSGATTQTQASAPAQDPTSFNLSGTPYDRRTTSQSPMGNQAAAPKRTISLEGL